MWGSHIVNLVFIAVIYNSASILTEILSTIFTLSLIIKIYHFVAYNSQDYHGLQGIVLLGYTIQYFYKFKPVKVNKIYLILSNTIKIHLKLDDSIELHYIKTYYYRTVLS